MLHVSYIKNNITENIHVENTYSVRTAKGGGWMGMAPKKKERVLVSFPRSANPLDSPRSQTRSIKNFDTIRENSMFPSIPPIRSNKLSKRDRSGSCRIIGSCVDLYSFGSSGSKSVTTARKLGPADEGMKYARSHSSNVAK